MSFLASISLIFVAAQTPVVVGCEAEATVRDPNVCEPLYSEGEFTIYSMESVAVGSSDEMIRVREMTRHCGLSNRIDYLGGIDLAVFDIVDATTQSRACVRDVIAEQAPELVFSKERLEQRFQSAPPLIESGNSQ